MTTYGNIAVFIPRLILLLLYIIHACIYPQP